MDRRTLVARGMACDGCERTVERALGGLGGVVRVDASHEDGTVEVVVEDRVDDATLRAAVEGAGYDVES
ncbi:MAG: heavy-metal-associated domain-containing protein [Haloferacaceae archaeon]